MSHTDRTHISLSGNGFNAVALHYISDGRGAALRKVVFKQALKESPAQVHLRCK